MGEKKMEMFLRIMVIFCAIALIGLTVPYWIYLKYAVDDSAWVAFAIYLISALLLIFLAFIGIFGAVKKNRGLLLYFAVVMIIMLLFAVAQIIVTTLDLTDCSDKGNNFSFLCSRNSAGYYAPVAVLLFINLFGAIVALVLRWKLVHDTSGNYY
ncbi:hypothetical protein PPL_01446 [Heterostelium album PN500]|uniref:Uncharacterized protein n=1 Tax=Heterostelium pallidum (strain ATCC 26659 / Pp 5 / PN500) TaxID=670386 RepID=D3AZA6_HETP5|nr:hypothetical protein PPL_01446 [Heterostelium album PN500]EFA85489.1 hypothetical protein PPL_01446 [Heterostelium album PN500]|eukprot:XP_020437597.1 hypothetical protein PPL_01446 [Heterostelium album PN500]